ncbi:alternate-type signal peptide domain-containing protein [Nocardioides sp. LHG3406-4]|uniref:alternate-type signal peptide domain-containing protein n=1 Tax=Nocardioides sp. LHG3406-4 TaxID=2804575 RepID=UPI003CEC901E
MNKITKGALAAVVAAVLLLGGAGTLAFWTDSQDVDAGSISTGHLSMVAVPGDTGTWTDITDGGSAAISDLAAFNMAPGDTLQYARTFTIDAEGDNLTAGLSTSALTPPASDLAAWVSSTVSTSGTAAPAVVTSADDGATITVLVDVAFDPATPGKVANGGVNAGDDDGLDLSSLTINLDQSQGAAQGN